MVERADEVDGRGGGEEIESEISSGDRQRQGEHGEGGDQEARNKREREREEREENQAPSTWYITLSHPSTQSTGRAARQEYTRSRRSEGDGLASISGEQGGKGAETPRGRDETDAEC